MSDFPINVTDLLILAVILISGFIAFSRGFIREVLSIAGWIGAAFAGVYGYPQLVPQILSLVPDPVMASWISGASIGVVTVIVLSLLGHHLAKMLRLDGLTAIDRSLGFLFGLVRGAVLVSLVFLALQWMVDKRDYPGWLNDAKSLPIATMGANLLARLLPDNLRPNISAVDAEAKRVIRKQVLERLVSPPPKSPASPDDPGYTSEQRGDMNSIIEKMQ